ncbi:hypothetical protein A9Q99_18210 [Gammaproteobacteria bacterium 45_16_T64]|nr:hypothetical protein A9Q99_18210 [Gammaproteobacteria bacterium 45_16_T64]
MIRERWEILLSDSHIPLDESSELCFDTLCTLYQEPHRYYHTFDHLSQMLWQLDLADITCVSVRWATFYHDAYYIPGDPENEQRSADLARNHLLLMGVEEKIIHDIEEMIIATKTHTASKDDNEDLCALLDVDMAILGVANKDYAAYCEKVRLEFSVIDEALYRAGRKRFLESVLAQDRIYLTDYFFSEFELQARKNMERELAFQGAHNLSNL